MTVLLGNSDSVKRSDVTRWKQGYITPFPHTSFCETQWRHSVKTRLYNTLPTHFFLWNAVTSLGEKQGYIRTLPILHCIIQLGENKGDRGHWVSQDKIICFYQLSVHPKDGWMLALDTALSRQLVLHDSIRLGNQTSIFFLRASTFFHDILFLFPVKISRLYNFYISLCFKVNC